MKLVSIPIKVETPTGDTLYRGDDTISVAAEKNLEIAYWNPGKTMILEKTVPAGKAWSVRVLVEITETDA